jgi:hypothetical protein
MMERARRSVTADTVAVVHDEWGKLKILGGSRLIGYRCLVFLAGCRGRLPVPFYSGVRRFTQVGSDKLAV